MQITKQQLKRIIKEELENVLEDQTGEEHVIERVGVSSDERYYVGYIYKDGRYEGVYGSKEEARKFSTKAKADRALPLLQKRDGYEYTVGPTSLEETQSEETTLAEGFQESYNWFMSLPPEHQSMILKSIGYLTGITSLTTAMMVGWEEINNRMKDK